MPVFGVCRVAVLRGLDLITAYFFLFFFDFTIKK